MKRLAVIVVTAACSTTESSAPDPAQLFTAACAPQTCETGSPATEAAHIDALIAASEWPGLAEYTTGCLPASKNIPVQGTITLRGADHDGKFRPRDLVPGVECIGAQYYWDFMTCDEVTLTNTTIRIRTVTQDIHPAPENHLRLIEILDACESGCAAETFACEATHTCWPTERDYCAYCLGGDNETCGCWEDGALLPNGSECSIFVSGDIIASGVCEAGRCEVY